jgi:NADH dehydrogenase/NADH:ubiquinone oxidoreductase subunit G
VRVAVPFNESLAEGLRLAAAQCVAACPTGALAFKDARHP